MHKKRISWRSCGCPFGCLTLTKSCARGVKEKATVLASPRRRAVGLPALAKSLEHLLREAGCTLGRLTDVSSDLLSWLRVSWTEGPASPLPDSGGTLAEGFFQISACRPAPAAHHRCREPDHSPETAEPARVLRPWCTPFCFSEGFVSAGIRGCAKRPRDEQDFLRVFSPGAPWSAGQSGDGTVSKNPSTE